MLPSQRSGRSASYPHGIGPQERRQAMGAQLKMLEQALAPWPRRHAPLLEVNCGNGAMLPFFWHCGFDVQATEEDATLRVKAQQQNVPGTEIYAASDDDLPFDNDSFDWVVIHLKSGDKNGIKSCHKEGARLARRGLMVTFWNTESLAALCWRIIHGRTWAENSAPWLLVWRHLRSLDMGRVSTVSTLILPPALWKLSPRKAQVSKTPIGAWCAVRLDIGSTVPVTPLPLRLGTNFTQDTVLEPLIKTRVTNSDATNSLEQEDHK